MKASGNPSFFKLCLLTLMFVSYTDVFVIGAPRGGHVVSGTASFTQDGNLTVITAGNRSIINYTSFDIGKNQTVQFIQPSATATVLNRVTSADPTNIFGHLDANGIVIIANPYGVFFQNGSVVNVGGLIAGAGKVSDADFAAGRIHFTDLTGDVRNDGVIAADNRIALMGANVVNTGSLTAAHGMAMMVSGSDVYVGEKNGNIFVQANGRAVRAASATASASAGSVTNSGTVVAPRVLLGAGDLYSTAIVNSGLLQGRAIAINAGKNGSATVGGTLDASSKTATGGNIDVLGGTVALQGATLDASGAAGGGGIRVGGDFHGGGTLATSATTTVDAATTIKADATGATGDGGTVVLWSDTGTYYGGNITARGGSASGNGGSVEVSSHNELLFRGAADLTAANGKTGTLLLDPSNITISDTGADYTGLTTLNPKVLFAGGNGTTPASTPITIPVTAAVGGLNTVLLTADVQLQANNDIFVNQSIAPGVGTHSLELDAGRSISLASNVTVTLGGSFTANFDDTAATQTIRGTGQGSFTMGTGSAITAPGGITISDTVTGITSTSATAGTISLTSLSAAGGAIKLTDVYSDANVTTDLITATGALTTTSGTSGAAGGALTLHSSGGISLAAITANGLGAGAGGNVSLTADGGNIVTGDITTDGPGAGKGGNVTMNAAGTATVNSITATSAGAGNGGTVMLTSADNMNVGAINASSTGTGNGGAVTLTVSGADSLTAAGVTSTGAGGGTGGAISLMANTGSLRLNGAITGGSLTTGTGTTTFNDGSGVTTSGGGQTYGGPVVLNQTAAGVLTTLTDSGTGNITFSSTVDSAPTTPGGATSTNQNLVVNAGGNEVFGGTVGAVDMLGNLTTDGNVTTGTVGTGSAQFKMVLPNTTAVGATAVNPAGVNLTGALTVNDGAVFNVQNNGAIVPSSATPSVFTTGAQSYAGGATLSSNTYLKSASTLALNGVTGTSSTALTLETTNATSALTLGGAATGLASLATVGGSAFDLNGGAVTTSGVAGQNYGEAVVLGAAAVSPATTATTTLTSNGGGPITFTSTVGGSTVAGTVPQSLSMGTAATGTPGAITFSGAVGPTAAPLLSLATTTIGTAVNINGGAVTTTGGTGQVYAGPVVLGATGATTLTANGSGPIDFESSLGGNAATGAVAQNLTVNTVAATTPAGATAGTITFGGIVGATTTPAAVALASLTTSTGSPVEIDGGAVTTTGDQTYGGTVTLGSTAGTPLTTLTGATLTSGILIDGSGTQSLTLNFTNGVTLVGGTTAAAGVITLNDIDNLTSSGAGGTTLEGSLTTAGNQDFTDAVTLAANTTLTSSGGTVTAGAVDAATFDLTVSAKGSSFGTITDGGDLLFEDGTGVATFTGDVNATSLDSTGAGGVTFTNPLTVTTSGAQTYTGLLTLGGATTLTSTGSTIMAGTLTGSGDNLTVTADTGSTFGAIGTGGLFPLGVLIFNGAGTSAFTGQISATSLAVTGGSGVTLSGGNAGSTDTVATTAGQTYGETLTLGADTTLLDTGKGNVSFGAINSDAAATARALTVATGGVTSFGGIVGATALSSLTVGLGAPNNQGGTADLDGGQVTTTGAQTYNDKALLGSATGATTLTAGTGAVTFALTLGSSTTTPVPAQAQALTVSTSGVTSFGGNVGGASSAATTAPALASLTISTGATDLGGVLVTTTGLQSYGALDLSGTGGVANVLTGTTVTATGATTGNGQPLTVDASTSASFGAITGAGVVRFDGAGTTALNGQISATSLAVTGGSGVTLGGGNAGGTSTVATTAGQTYAETLTLGADTTLLDTGKGNVSFGAINSDAAATARALTVATGGVTSFGGIVGATALSSLTVGLGAPNNQGGTADLDGGQVTTTGAQTYNDKALLGSATGATTLTAGTGAVTFALTLGSSTTTPVPAQAQALTVSTSGVTSFGGNVGGASSAATTAPALASLTISTGATDLGGVLVTTTGLQSYGALDLSGTGGVANVLTGTTVTATGATTGNGQPLTVDASTSASFGAITGAGVVRFDGAGTTALNGQISATSLAVTGGSGVTLGGGNAGGTSTVATTAGQTYAETLTLGADTTLLDTGKGNVSFGAINSDAAATARALTVATGGVTSFGGIVGATALSSLTVGLGAPNNQGGTADLDGGQVTTTGAQTYNDKVVLGIAGATMQAPLTTTLATSGAGASITFNNTLNGNAPGTQGLIVNAPGNEVFNMSVGATVPLASLTTDSNGSLGGDTIFAATAPATSTSVTTTELQSYNDPVLLQADTVLTAGSLALGSTIDGAATATTGHNLTLTIGSAITISGGTTVGQAAAGVLNDINNFVANGSGTVSFNGDFETYGSQTYANQTIANGPLFSTQVYLVGSRTFSSDNNAAITFGPVDSATPGTYDGLTVLTDGTTTFIGQLGGANPLGSVTVTGVGGSTVFGYTGAGNTVQTVNDGTDSTGAQTYNNAVTLTGNTFLQSRPAGTATIGGSISFADAAATVDGPHALTLDTTGATTFDGLVGSQMPLASLTIVAGSTTGTTVATTAIDTTGAQTYGSPLVLGSDVTLTTTTADPVGGTITFNSTVGGSGFNLTTATAVNGGNTVFGVASGSTTSPINSLITSVNGETIFYAPSFTTTGNQTYQNPVVVQRITSPAILGLTLSSTGGSIDFEKTLTTAGPVARDVTVTTGTAAGESVTFGGAVGGTADTADASSLNSLTVTSPTINIDGGTVNTASTVPRTVPDANGDGVQTYNGTVLLGEDTTFVGTTVAASGDFNAQNHSVTLTLSGVVTVPLGNFLNVDNFTSNGTGGTDIAGSFLTAGFQHYENAVTLTGDATVTAGTVAGQDSIRFDSTLYSPGAYNLTLSTGGPIVFTGVVGGTVSTVAGPLGSLTTTGGGTNFLNGGAVTTNGDQTYGGPVVLGPTTDQTMLTSNSGATISFGTATTAETVNGNLPGVQALTTDTSGAVFYYGAVGTTPLASLTANGTGTTNINGGAITTTGGGQSYAGPVEFNTAVTTTLSDTTTGNLYFGSTVNNSVAGTPTETFSTGGNITFNNTVGSAGALGNLTATAGGTIFVDGGSVNTSGSQTYQDFNPLVLGAVSLGKSTTFTSTNGGAVTFDATVNGIAQGAQSLKVDTTGNTVFNGLVGNAFTLEGLTTDAGGQTQFNMAIGTAAAGVNVSGDVKIGDAVLFAATGSSFAHPTVLTTGSQAYNGGGSATQSTALVGGGTLTSADTLDFGGTNDLSVRLGGLVTLPGGLVNVRNFITDGAGGTLVNGTFTTEGTQTYSNNVTVAGTPVLTSVGNLVFNDPVDGNAPLSLSATGAGAQVIFNPNALVGNTTPLGALTIGSTSGAVFGMNAGAATIGANRGGVNAASVTVNQGPVFFGVTNTTSAHPSILTTGAQTYDGAATLQADTSLVSSGGGNIAFNVAAATIDSAPGTLHALTTSTTGTQTFTGLIGSMTPLASLTTGTGPTDFDMTIPTSPTVAAGVAVDGAVTIGGPVTFDVANSSLTQPSVLTLGNGAQTYGGLVTLQGTITVLNSANTEPALGTFNGGGAITFDGNIFSPIGTSELDVRAGVGTAEFDGPVTTTGDFSPGGASVVFKGSVGPLGTFTVEPNNGGTGTGLIDLNGGNYTIGGLAFFNLPTVLSANTTLQAGNVTFANTLNGSNLLTNIPYTLTINVNGGTIAFKGVVGGTVPLESLVTGNVGATLGTTIFEMALPAVGSGLGGVNVINAVTINTNAVFAATGAGAGTVPTILSGVTYNGQVGTGTQTYGAVGTTLTGAAVTLSQNTALQDKSATGSITFNGVVNGTTAGGQSLSVNANGDEVFNQLVGNQFTLASLSTDNLSGTTGATRFDMNLTQAGAVAGVQVAGAVNIDDLAVFDATGGSVLPTILSGGAQTYALAGTVGQGTVLTANSGDISFLGAVDSGATASALTVNTPGNEVYRGLVGNSSPLASLTTDATGPATGAAEFLMTRPSNLPGGSTLGGVNVTGNVLVNDGVFFQVGNTLNVAPFQPSVSSGGSQTYVGAATLAARTVLVGAGGVAFDSTVDSNALAMPQSLTISTPVNTFITFGQAVGGTFPLADLHTTGAGTTRINGGLVATTSSQLYEQAVTLGQDAILRSTGTADGIDFDNSLDGNHSLTVSAAGSASFETVGNTSPLLNLTITAPVGTSFFYTPTLVMAGNAEVNLAGALTINGPVSFNAANAGDVVFVRTGVTVPGFTGISGQDYFGAFSLNGSGTFTDLKSGDITFHQTVDDVGSNNPSNLTASTGGTVSFLQPVGATNPLTSLTTSNLGLASGLTVLGGGSVATTGAQTYNDAVSLGATTTLTSTVGGNIAFNSTLDSNTATPQALTVNTSGQTIFGGAVGAVNALASVTTDNEGAADQGTFINGGNVTTTGAQTYNDAVSLGATTTVTATAGGNIAFDSTLDSNTAATPQALTVNTSGRTVFRGAVGAANTLASLTTDNEGTQDAGTFINGGSVTTVGAQTYNDAVMLGAAATLTSAAGGNIAFNSKLDSNSAGPQALTVDTSGQTIFGGMVGAANALASVTTDNEGAADQGTFINGGSVTTTGAQTYNDAVTLGANTALASTANGTLVFNSTVNGASALTLDTGGRTIFNSPVGNVTPLTALTTDDAGVTGEATQFNLSVGPAAGVVVNGPVTINDAVFFNVTGSSLTQPGILTLGNSDQTYNGPATLGTSTFLTTAKALPVVGGAFTGGGTINFNSAGGIVSSGGDNLFVRAGVGVDTVTAAVNVGNVDFGGASAVFRGPITLPGTLSIEPNDNTGGGSVAFSGPSLTTTGAQTYNVAFVLGANTVLTSTGGGNITFASTVDGAFALTLDTTGNEIFDNRIGGTTPLASLTTDDPTLIQGGGHVIFAFAGGTTAAPSVTTTGFQSYNDAAILRADTVLASTGGSRLMFGSTVDSDAAATPRALTLNTAGNEVFDGQVGGGAALASLTTDDPAANTSGGQAIFNVPTGTPSVTTTGLQTYHDAVLLKADTVLTSTGGGNLTFGSTVDGAFALTLSTAGTTTLAGVVGGGNGTALASLTTQGGPLALDGGAVTTTGVQSYNGVVVLGADTTLTSTGANGGITFALTVDSDAVATARALTLDAAGDETFNGRVGGNAALASVTTDDPAAKVSGGHMVFNIDSGTAPGVTTTGAQTYHDAALLQKDTTLTSTGGGNLTFGSTVDGAFALTLSTAGTTTLAGVVGGGNGTALASLTTQGGPLALDGGAVTTTGVQSYNGVVVLGADTTLTSTGANGGITFALTVDSDAVATARALTLDAAGDETFNGRVGGNAALASVTTDDPAAKVSGGHMVFNIDSGTAPGVTTTGAQTYHDAAILREDTTLTSTGNGRLDFASTVDNGNITNPRALTFNTGGDVVLGGLVGADKAIGNLTTNAGGQTEFNMDLSGQKDGVAGVNVVGTVTTNNAALFDAPGSSPLNPTVQSTVAQAYNGKVTLGADTILASSGGGAVTFNSTVDGSFALTLNTSGPTTFNGAVGSNSPALTSLTAQGGGEVILLNAGSVATTGAQSYSGPVSLRHDTIFTSSNSGITFFSNVYGNYALTLSTGGATTFDQPVGAVSGVDANDAELATLTANPGSAVVINGGSLTTHGLQTYGGTLTINGAGGGQTILTATDNETSAVNTQRGNIIFAQNVNVDSGSLRVNGDRILAEAGANIDVAGAGNLDLEASDLLILQGSSYGSASGTVTLNDPRTATNATTETRATIYLTGQKTLFHGGGFDMGFLQNMYSLGSVTINVGGGTAFLSDIAANNALTVTAGSIVLRARNPDPTRGGPGGGSDDGLNFVARNSINFGNTAIRYDNTHSSNDQANFVTSSGLVTVNRDQTQGISIFQDETLGDAFQQVNNNLNFNDGQFAGFVSPFQPISGGTQTIDTAAALSGALPDQKPLDVAVDITVTASQMEELKKLGIHPRTAQKQERLSLGSKRALFAQLVDGQDQDNYGRLQPIKGGISRLVPSDYVVVVDRMSEREVQQILTAFEELYGKNKEKVPPIGGAFNTAFTDYTTEKQTADPAGFAPYIESKPGKYPAVDKAVRGFDNLFGYIESLGLTEKEQAKAKEHIASDLEVAGVSPEDMVKVIDTLRTKIPKDQKASSTKLPSSPPVSAPAPGATNPAQPEKKPDVPLKTAAHHSRKESTRKTARQIKPLKDDRVHEVAGL